MSLNPSMVRRGVAEALPLFLTVIPFALVVGLAVIESGLNPLVGWSTSPIVFGGAAQLVLITLLGEGIAVAAAVSAALVIQARHLMYSAAMAPTFQRQPKWFQWFGPYVLIDQMFALAATRTHEEPADFRSYYLGAAAVYIVGWNLTTAAGLVLGPQVPPSWQLGFAVPLMFVVLLVSGINRWPKLVAAVAAAGTTYLAAGLPNRTGLLIGGLVGIAAGVVASRWRR